MFELLIGTEAVRRQTQDVVDGTSRRRVRLLPPVIPARAASALRVLAERLEPAPRVSRLVNRAS